MLTASFSEARRDLTAIAERVSRENVEFTIFKRSKPLFKIVPVAEAGSEQEGVHPARTTPTSRVDTSSHDFPRACDAPDSSDTIPEQGADLFAYAMALRERAPRSRHLADLSIEDMKRELGERHA